MKLLFFIFLLTASLPSRSESRPPNVVIVFADDLGWFDVGFNGNKSANTPNLDRMAREGMRLTDFYVGQTVCSASRAALLTGCYPNRVGIIGALGPRSTTGISPYELSMAEMLKQNGYATAIYGKWHLGYQSEFLPTRHGFDEYFGLPYSNDMWPKHPTNPNYPPLPLIEGDQVKEHMPDQTRLTSWYTDRAVGFIRRNRSRPFFLYVPHSMPHVPLFASERFRGKSGKGVHHEVMQEIDWSVGEILKTLSEQGLDRNTLVIFTSDNGPWLSYGNHAGSAGPFREGKATTFEGGIRVPFVARWPGRIPPGKVSREPAMTIDILPTLAGIADVTLPTDRTIDGKNIWPLLSNQKGAKSPHEALYFYWDRALEAVRSGKWKLHFPHEYRHMAGPPGQDGRPNGYQTARIELSLYDLESDPGESKDVAAQNPEVVQRLTELSNRIRSDLGDSATGITGTGIRQPGRVR